MTLTMSLNRGAHAFVLAMLLAGSASWVGAAPPPDQAVAEARQELLISEAVAQRIWARLVQVRQLPNVAPEELAELKRYWQRLEEATREHRAKLAWLQAQRQLPPSADPARQAFERAPRSAFVIVPERTEADDIAALDAELNRSLSQFDEMLLKEMDELRQTAASASTHDGDAAMAGEAGTGDEGVSTEEGTGQPNGQRGEMTASRGEMDESRGEQAANGHQRLPRQPTGESEADGGRVGTPFPVPSDIPDGSDDDLVARQIRHAAMTEPDPALREKLWEEYRKYKQGAGHAPLGSGS